VIIKPTSEIRPEMVSESFARARKAELALKKYDVVYGSLMANNVPFTIIQEYETLTPTRNHVFLYPNYLIKNDDDYNELLKDVKSGAHAIFLYEPEHVFSYKYNKSIYRIIDFLGIKVDDIALTDKVYIDGEIIDLPPNLFVAELGTESSNYSLRTIGYYKTSENTSIPLILYFAIENGSITLINFPKYSFLDTTLVYITTKTIKTIIANLPKPESLSSLKTLPYPEDLFKLGHASLVNLYKLKGLVNYVYAFSDLKLEGNITISSDFINWCEENILTGKLILRGSSDQKWLKDVSITSISVNGFFDFILITQEAFVINSSCDLANIKISFPAFLRINADKTPINIIVNKNGIQKELTISRGYIDLEFAKNFTTYIQLRKLLITLDNGSLNTSWKGVFWHDSKMFTTVSRTEYWPIKGDYSIKILHCNNITLIKLINIKSITVDLNEQK